ncbi:hypothetical protein HRI_004960300 [Hibiscus trionum]|nr:hypothetical protein HRI_004960300 [Hibiscus trionum]
MFTRFRYASYKPENRFEWLLHPYKSTALGNSASNGFPVNNQGLRFISNNSMGMWRKLDTDIFAKDEMGNVRSAPGAGSECPSRFNFSLWARCLLGSVLGFFLPFWKIKWANLKRIEGEAEMVVEVAENAAEVVEEVATAAENMSAEAAEKLPDDSKLKKAAMVVEHVSEITAQDAHVATQIIHQVEGLKHDLDGLEALVEPIVHKIIKQGPQEK